MRTHHPAADLFPLMEGSDFAALVADIRINGLFMPITVDDQGRILDGRNRDRACDRTGVEPRYETYSGPPGGELAFVISMNLKRRHLNESQRAMIAVRLSNMRRGQRTDLNLPSNEGRLSQDAAAKLMNVSVATVERAALVLRSGTPEQITAVDRGTESLGSLAVRISRQQQAEAIRREPPPLPGNGPYRTITSDAPLETVIPYHPDHNRAAPRYSTMSVEELVAMGPQVQALVHEHSTAWFWIREHYLIAGAHIPILRAWDFTPRKILIWEKTSQDGSVRFGMGDLLRNAAEFCVLATRGNPVILGGDQATVQRWPAQSLHSKKPPEFYGWIELVCPAPRYCSLFHRGPLRPGWGGFGDECGEVEQAEDEADEEE